MVYINASHMAPLAQPFRSPTPSIPQDSCKDLIDANTS